MRRDNLMVFVRFSCATSMKRIGVMRQYRATIDASGRLSKSMGFPSTVINVRQRQHDCQRYGLELELRLGRQTGYRGV
jgi:hypothetical protein